MSEGFEFLNWAGNLNSLFSDIIDVEKAFDQFIFITEHMHSLVVLLITLRLGAVLGCSSACSLCDPTGTTCFVCSDPLARPIEGGQCSVVPLVSGCQTYSSSNSRCVKCELGHRLASAQLASGTTVRCDKDMTGCLKFTAEGACRECGFGTILSNGACRGIIHCKTYNTVNTRICS